MTRRLRWRMWLFRMGRRHERWLRLAALIGFVGLPVTLLLREVAPQIGPGWQLLGMGASLVLAGMGHALVGEGSTIAAYARGESDEMPAAGKMASGLLASCGGVLIALTGLAQVAG